MTVFFSLIKIPIDIFNIFYYSISIGYINYIIVISFEMIRSHL